MSATNSSLHKPNIHTGSRNYSSVNCSKSRTRQWLQSFKTCFGLCFAKGQRIEIDDKYQSIEEDILQTAAETDSAIFQIPFSYDNLQLENEQLEDMGAEKCCGHLVEDNSNSCLMNSATQEDELSVENHSLLTDNGSFTTEEQALCTESKRTFTIPETIQEAQERQLAYYHANDMEELYRILVFIRLWKQKTSSSSILNSELKRIEETLSEEQRESIIRDFCK